MSNQANLTGFTVTKAKIQSDYRIIAPGKIIVKATGRNTTWHNTNLADSSETYSHSILVNFFGIEERKQQAVNEIFQVKDEEGNITYKNEVDLGELRNMLFVHQIIVNEGQEDPKLPMAGEEVELLVEQATDKTGELIRDKVTNSIILRVRQMTVKHAVKAPAFLFSTVNAETKDPAQVERVKMGETITEVEVEKETHQLPS